MRFWCIALAVLAAPITTPPAAPPFPDTGAVTVALAAAGPPVLQAVYAPHDRWGRDQHGPFGVIGSYFPDRAYRLDVSGAVVLQCAVALDGKLSACTVLIATPPDFNFGDAALAMAKDGYLSAKPAEGFAVSAMNG